MNFAKCLKGDSLYIHVCTILSLWLLTFAYQKGEPLLLLTPFLLIGAAIVVSFPNALPLFFIASFFCGPYLANGPMFGVSLTDVFSLLVVIGCINAIVARPKSPRLTYQAGLADTVVRVMLLFGAVCVISVLANLTRLKGKETITASFYVLKLAQMIVIYVVFANIRFTKAKFHKYIDVLLVLAGFQFIVALYQYVTGGGIASAVASSVHGTLTNHHGMLGTLMLIPLALAGYRMFTADAFKAKLC
ncbi:MAG: hypothetical protein GF344_09385, partial [Chitinivibrionales bacterium]|nr:hypothetical protein [Chitinivibrionales bacterium]MBD3357063.1 hypothetical protein [Chitinivibrionales bacterium]